MTKSVTTKNSVETKTTKPAPTAAAVEAQVVASVEKKVAAPKKEKKAKQPEAAAPVVAAAPAAATAAASENVVVAETSSSSSISEDFAAFFGKLQSATSLLSTLKSDFRQLEKKFAKQLKVSQKASAKRKNSAVNRAPSGFVQPTLISDELASFLGKDKGSKMARTEVTREINAYIRTHNLQDKANGRRINADKSLSALLKLKSGDELTYFNLQRYMSPHFAKTAKAAVATA
jgi:chromatin remodeling complex protein RSC6